VETSGNPSHIAIMAPKHPKRPKDFSQAAKLVVDIATGQAEPDRATTVADGPAAEFARSGGLKGGIARAASLSHQAKPKTAAAMTNVAIRSTGYVPNRPNAVIQFGVSIRPFQSQRALRHN
jgi:hypothetical protein